MSRNDRYFICHRYDIDISKKPISKVMRRYDTELLILSISAIYHDIFDILTHLYHPYFSNIISGFNVNKE